MRTYFRYNAVVSMQWLLFGSNGHTVPPPEGQLEGFQRCTGSPSRQMKCLANTYWFHTAGVFQQNQVHQSFFRCAPPPLGTLDHRSPSQIPPPPPRSPPAGGSLAAVTHVTSTARIR